MHLGNRETTLLVDALKSQYPLAEICICLDLARSSYFYHRARLQMGDKYAGIRHKIREVFEQNYQCFGYRRIRAFLARERIALSEKVVQRLMRQEQFIVATKRRRYRSYWEKSVRHQKTSSIETSMLRSQTRSG